MKSPIFFFNQKGQSTIEALIILPILILAFSYFGVQVFNISKYAALDLIAEKSILCATAITVTECQEQALTQIHQLNSQIQVQLWDLQKFGIDFYQLRVELKLPSNETLYFKKELTWGDQGPTPDLYP